MQTKPYIFFFGNTGSQKIPLFLLGVAPYYIAFFIKHVPIHKHCHRQNIMRYLSFSLLFCVTIFTSLAFMTRYLFILILEYVCLCVCHKQALTGSNFSTLGRVYEFDDRLEYKRRLTLL